MKRLVTNLRNDNHQNTTYNIKKFLNILKPLYQYEKKNLYFHRKKWAKHMNGEFTVEKIQMILKNWKGCKISFIREM